MRLTIRTNAKREGARQTEGTKIEVNSSSAMWTAQFQQYWARVTRFVHGGTHAVFSGRKRQATHAEEIARYTGFFRVIAHQKGEPPEEPPIPLIEERMVVPDQLEVEDWALTIAVAFETSTTLTDAAKKELAKLCECPKFAEALSEALDRSGYLKRLSEAHERAIETISR